MGRECKRRNRNHGGQLLQPCTRAESTTSMTDCSMRRVLWDFGRAAVQPGGSHGVALLSHRRGSSFVLYVYICDSFQTCIHRAPAHADLCVCVHGARGTARRDMYLTLQGEPVIRQFAETKEEREKMDVTVCYRLKNNFHLLGPISMI